MLATVAISTRYKYDARAMRYRDVLRGRWVKGATVKRAVNKVIREAGEAMKRLTGDMIARRITLSQWQDQFAAEIKNLHLSSAMAGAGGMANMTPADYGRVGRRLRFEYERLDRFARQLQSRAYTSGQVYNRVAMYVGSGSVSFEAARRDQAFKAGMAYERNVLGDRKDHCEDDGVRPGCVQLTLLGTVPIGTLAPIGERVCMSHCGCTIRYSRKLRRANDAKQT